MSQAFVYLLHFERPLHHSQHYAGCCNDIKRRLSQHARGQGSLITRALVGTGVRFVIGGLWLTGPSTRYRVERALKDTHAMSRHCEICAAEGERGTGWLENATPYDPANLPFRLDLMFTGTAAPPDVLVEKAIPEDMEAILELMRRDRIALGFIPAGGNEGVRLSIERGRTLAAKISGRVIGYCLFTYRTAAEGMQPIKVHQVCVADEMRLLGVGEKLVKYLELNYPGIRLECNVREDLPANYFWRNIGFHETHKFRHRTSGSTLIHYEKEAV